MGKYWEWINDSVIPESIFTYLLTTNQLADDQAT